MKKEYKIFNYSCLILSGLFLLGTIFIYVRTTKDSSTSLGTSEITNYENNIETKKLGNLETSVVVERDSSTTSSFHSDFARNDTVNLAVPFTSQAPEKNWEQPWQDACEEAAVLMLDAYYKNYNLSPLFSRDEILKMVEWEEAQGWGNSIEMEKVKQMAEEYLKLAQPLPSPPLPEMKLGTSSGEGRVGLKIIENPIIDDIKKFITAGKPVLVLAHGKDLPNPYFRGDGPEYHALIIRGYTDEKFITNDPGTQWGENFAYYYQDLLFAIHDWNDGNVKEGRRVVLVVED